MIIFPLKNPKSFQNTVRYDNDPGTLEVSGSQDSIGITMPGINKFFYDKGKYWPSHFDTISDPAILKWLEERLCMVTLWPRPVGFNVLSDTNINEQNVKSLTDAADLAWEGLLGKDMKKFSKGFLDSIDSP